MEYVLITGWIIGSVIVSFIANDRGRSYIVWLVLSVVISPICSGATLLLLKDNALSVLHFKKQMTDLHNLFVAGMISSAEFSAGKSVIIDDISTKKLNGTKDEFLCELIPLFRVNILTADEINTIKVNILQCCR
jgi:hypothetical protein